MVVIKFFSRGQIAIEIFGVQSNFQSVPRKLRENITLVFVVKPIIILLALIENNLLGFHPSEVW